MNYGQSKWTPPVGGKISSTRLAHEPGVDSPGTGEDSDSNRGVKARRASRSSSRKTTYESDDERSPVLQPDDLPKFEQSAKKRVNAKSDFSKIERVTHEVRETTKAQPGKSRHETAHSSKSQVDGGRVNRDINQKEFDQVAKELRELGVTSYRLEVWEENGPMYQFSCEMDLGSSTGQPARFSAIHQDHLTAMRMVVNKIQRALSE